MSVGYLKKFMCGVGSTRCNQSYLTNLPEFFVRKAFYGLFAKSPFMALDEFEPQSFCRTLDKSIPPHLIVQSTGQTLSPFMALSRNIKKQQKLLLDEYERLGKPLDKMTLEELVVQVDRELSRHQCFVVHKPDTKGPNGEERILSNTKVSIWLPKGKWHEEIHFTDEGTPFIYDEGTKASHFCIDLMKKYLDTPSGSQTGPANSTSNTRKVPLPLPGSDAKKPESSAPASSVPLPGMKPHEKGNTVLPLFLKEARSALCAAAAWTAKSNIKRPDPETPALAASPEKKKKVASAPMMPDSSESEAESSSEEDIKEFKLIQDSTTGQYSVEWDHPKGKLTQQLPAEGRNYKLHRCEKDGKHFGEVFAASKTNEGPSVWMVKLCQRSLKASLSNASVDSAQLKALQAPKSPQPTTPKSDKKAEGQPDRENQGTSSESTTAAPEMALKAKAKAASPQPKPKLVHCATVSRFFTALPEEKSSPNAAPDEEALQCKAMNILAYNLHSRILLEPEYASEAAAASVGAAEEQEEEPDKAYEDEEPQTKEEMKSAESPVGSSEGIWQVVYCHDSLSGLSGDEWLQEEKKTLQKLHQWVKFLYTITAPVLRTIQWPQLRLTLADFMRLNTSKNKTATSRQEMHQKTFRVARDSLAKSPALKKELTPLALQKKYKNAGTIANQKAAAATAWITHHTGKWELCGLAWAGVFLQKGSLFRDRAGRLAMSFGFREWGALGTVLEEISVNGEDSWVYAVFRDSGALPMWMFNHLVARDSLWKKVPFELMLPALAPKQLAGRGCVIKCSQIEEEIVPAAIHSGIFLTRDQLWSLHLAETFKLPPKGEGSGKRGALVKSDLAKAAIKPLLPHGATRRFSGHV
ncbi:unnamed protein product [Effrenium voratum]|uniref:Uncharacterized protein n=1 Tax=Effrenium voratum TaxID=2562239 RepID=A0AA36NGJ9_9DINO|nr:unnamed protein product [Effrenium voratum]